MGTLQNMLVAGSLVSLMAFMIIFVIADYSSTYGITVETQNLSTFNRISDFQQIGEEKAADVRESNVIDTENTENTFIVNSFTFAKDLITGRFFTVIVDMLKDFTTILRLPPQIYLGLLGILTIVIAFAIYRNVRTGDD